jgi:hypothetical protein
VGSERVLAEFRGPRLQLRLRPLDCPVAKSNETGRREVDVARCSPAQLQITTDPVVVRGAHSTPASYVGAQCRWVARGQLGARGEEGRGEGGVGWGAALLPAAGGCCGAGLRGAVRRGGAR